MRMLKSHSASTTFAALHAFAATYERRCGQRLSPTRLTHDPDALRDALETAAGAEDPELYAAAERLVLTLNTAPPYQAAGEVRLPAPRPFQ